MENEKALVEKDDSLPFRMMDALDDQLIIAELEGRMPEILTYHFSDKGQEVWGLSKAGVDEATGELSKQGEVIREMELNFTDGEHDAFFTVKAGRYVIAKNGQEILLDTKFGTKRQNKKTIGGKDNTFWYEQGSIKACRNASMRLIPKTIVQAVIESAKSKGKVKEVKKEDVTGEIKQINPEYSASYLAEVKKHLDGYKNLFELRNGYKKHFHEWQANLLAEDLVKITEYKDGLKKKFEGEK